MTTTSPPNLLPLPVASVHAWTRLAWVGDLDATAAESLTAALTPVWGAAGTMLEVDLAGVTSVDRDGLRPLVEAHGRLLDRMRLFAPSRPVTELLETLGLSQMFTVVGPWPCPPAPDARAFMDACRSVGEDPDGWGRDEPALPTPRSISDRAIIEQAKGLIMGADGCTASAAWEVLRESARSHQVPIRVMARGLLAEASNGLSQVSDRR